MKRLFAGCFLTLVCGGTIGAVLTLGSYAYYQAYPSMRGWLFVALGVLLLGILQGIHSPSSQRGSGQQSPVLVATRGGQHQSTDATCHMWRTIRETFLSKRKRQENEGFCVRHPHRTRQRLPHHHRSILPAIWAKTAVA
jgi:hypothetical protein